MCLPIDGNTQCFISADIKWEEGSWRTSGMEKGRGMSRMNGPREEHGTPRNGGWRDESSLTRRTLVVWVLCLFRGQTSGPRTQTEGLALPLRLCLATSWLCVFSLSVKWGKGSPCIIPLKFPVIFQEYSGFDPGLSCHHFSGLG